MNAIRCARLLKQAATVFEVEYSKSTSSFCPTANATGISAMKKREDLDAWRQPLLLILLGTTDNSRTTRQFPILSFSASSTASRHPSQPSGECRHELVDTCNNPATCEPSYRLNLRLPRPTRTGPGYGGVKYSAIAAGRKPDEITASRKGTMKTRRLLRCEEGLQDVYRRFDPAPRVQVFLGGTVSAANSGTMSSGEKRVRRSLGRLIKFANLFRRIFR